MARSAAAESLRETTRPVDGDAGISAAMRLGAEAIRLYAELHGVSREAARRALRAQRVLGRRPSVANEE